MNQLRKLINNIMIIIRHANYMKMSPFSEAVRSAATKKFPKNYGTLKFITCSQGPSTGPYPEPDKTTS
jgi:hypothetical protein